MSKIFIVRVVLDEVLRATCSDGWEVACQRNLSSLSNYAIS